MRIFCARAENSRKVKMKEKTPVSQHLTMRDPIAILIEIMNDRKAPATARVAAAKALLLANKGAQPAEDTAIDDVTRRALEIAAGRTERKVH
jgi:hypothetical protein